jgi:hypothetical protein
MSVRTAWATSSTTAKTIAIAFVIMLVVIIGLMWELNTARGADARAALAESQARAKADTTRMLRDSLGFQRLVIQQVQKSDAYDQELGEMRRALLQLGVLIATKSVTNREASSATTETASGARLGVFDVRQEPYTMHAVVTLPAPPAKGAIDASFALDPLGLSARLGCTSKVNTLGMRDALLTVKPVRPGTDSLVSWAKISIDHVEQDPSVCPSPVLQKDLSADDRSRLALVFGYGFTYPSPATRAFVGIAISKPLPCPALLRKRLPGC